MRRAKMRRRLRRQERVREMLLLELGALAFELHRQHRREPELLQAKGAEVYAVDVEVRRLADALGVDYERLAAAPVEMLESCQSCGTVVIEGARFCFACGVGRNGEAVAEEPGDAGVEHVDSSRDTTGERVEEAPPAAQAGAEPDAPVEPVAREAAEEDQAQGEPPLEGVEPASGAPAEPMSDMPAGAGSERSGAPASDQGQPPWFQRGKSAMDEHAEPPDGSPGEPTSGERPPPWFEGRESAPGGRVDPGK